MTYEELLVTEPTLSQNNSQKLFFEICHQGWRCYSNALGDIESLVDRFLTSHARIPGAVTEQMLANQPLETLMYNVEGLRVIGSLFLNGAVVSIFPPGKPSTQLLFVSDSTAERWSYPNHSYRYLEEHGGPE